MQQGTDEWFEARAGKLTASRMADVLAKIKTGESASRSNYKLELVCERMTGLKESSFTNSHMERGVELEPIARSLYEIKKNVLVNEVGFIDHPVIAMSGASPDGLVGDDGQIEIKCPTPANHINTVLSGKSPSKYYAQMQWQLACTGRKWCDFISYCPAVGDNLEMFIVRVNRDDQYIQILEIEAVKFLSEVDEMLNLLKGVKNG